MYKITTGGNILKKIVLGLIVTTSLFTGINSVSAHNLPNAGSESKGWKYVGSHWPSTSTKYFEATTDTWESRFKSGASKFRSESGSKFSISEVSVGNTQNFIENSSSSSATWVARRTVYSVSNDHPARWRIQFNSAKSANSWTTVAAHEIGHVFGLDDLYEGYNNKKLMYGYDSGVRYMQSSDKAGFNYIY